MTSTLNNAGAGGTDAPHAKRRSVTHRSEPSRDHDLPRRTPRVSVVIPALNEASNLEHVLTRVGSDVFEVVLVDGNSVDDTVAVARRFWPEVRVIQQTRQGKGNALACGFHACRGDIIVMLDADGSTDAAEIPSFVEALTDGAHFAKGTRFGRGGGSDDITRFRSWGNASLNRLVNRLYGTRYTDLCYGYNAFWASCLDDLDLSEPGHEVTHDSPHRPVGDPEPVRWGDGFEIETLLTVRVSMLGMRVAEVPSFESPRLNGRSNLHAFRDGWRVLRTIAAERRRFTPMASNARPLPEPWQDYANRADVEELGVGGVDVEEVIVLDGEGGAVVEVIDLTKLDGATVSGSSER